MDDERRQWFETLSAQTAESDKDWWIAFCLSLFFGWLGADRLYLGSPWIGIIKFCTFGGFCVWWMIDIILLLCGAMSDGEGRRLKS